MIQLGGLLKKNMWNIVEFQSMARPCCRITWLQPLMILACGYESRKLSWSFWEGSPHDLVHAKRIPGCKQVFCRCKEIFRVYTLLLARITSWRLQQNWSTWIIFSRVFTKVSKTQLFVPSSECLTMRGKKRHVLLQLKTKHPPQLRLPTLQVSVVQSWGQSLSCCRWPMVMGKWEQLVMVSMQYATKSKEISLWWNFSFWLGETSYISLSLTRGNLMPSRLESDLAYWPWAWTSAADWWNFHSCW